jgi:hypothetical protein
MIPKPSTAQGFHYQGQQELKDSKINPQVSNSDSLGFYKRAAVQQQQQAGFSQRPSAVENSQTDQFKKQ